MARWFALFCLLLSASVAQGEDEEAPTSRLYMESLLATRINPGGLLERFYLSYRHKLSESEHILLADTYFSVGPVIALTPGNISIGPQLKFQPLAILGFRASYEFFGSFGSFRQVQQFDSLSADYSDTALKSMGGVQKRIGGIVNLEGRFQIKLGPIATRNTFLMRRYDIRSDADQVAFYDQNADLLSPNHGWIWTNDLDLLFVLPSGFTVGARWTAAQALHGEGQNTDVNHRVGPILAMTLFNHPGAAFNTPTLFVISQWHAEHPYRTGEDSSVWMPTISIGFGFTGDLVPW